jgi:tRNA (guanine26-N2/guanine27-N2)-dimethyltransferase
MALIRKGFICSSLFLTIPMKILAEGEIVFEAEGVFYNPRMRLGRDICVAMARSLEVEDYLDALSASGIRGLRVAKEAGVARVTLNDASPRAHEIIVKNITRNNLTCEAVCSNANVLMHSRHFQAVDIDPFGSPSPFLSAASRSSLSLLFLTATDTAPLCGAHPKSGIRKYMAVPLNTDFHREMGLRVLLGLAARELARLDKSMSPLLAHATEHYVRAYLKVKKGAALADRCLEKMGYLECCLFCGSFSMLKEPKEAGICSHCTHKTLLAGPLWLGSLHQPSLLKQAMTYLKEGPARRLLLACASEEDTPMYYDHHSICERLGTSPGKIERVIESLRQSGWKASRTHISGLGIKTDAPLREVEDVVKTAKSSGNL